MKKMITSALVLALTVGAAQAQNTSTEKGKADRREHRMHQMKDLNLTEEQKAKMKALREEQKKELQALKGNKSATQEQRKELHKKYREQMQAILTPEQRQQMQKMKEERKASGKKTDFNKKQGFAQKGNFKRGENLQKELNLTEDQKDKMAKIRTDFRGRFEALRKDNSLTREQKKSKMQELMKAQNEQIKTVLTKQQIEKMESLKKERSSRNTK